MMEPRQSEGLTEYEYEYEYRDAKYENEKKREKPDAALDVRNEFGFHS